MLCQLVIHNQGTIAVVQLCILHDATHLFIFHISFSSAQFSSVAQSCPTLCDPMNCSTPGLPVHHQLPEFTQTHIPWVSDAIQPSHPLSSPSPPAPNPSQHQSFPMSQLFAWGGQSRKVNKLSNVNYILSISMMLMFRLNVCDKENHDMLWGGQLHHCWSWPHIHGYLGIHGYVGQQRKRAASSISVRSSSQLLS